MRVKSVKDPGSDNGNVQHQCVLVAQPQSTAQRSPTRNLRRWTFFYCNIFQTMCVCGSEAVGSCVTLILCSALSAQWKEAVKTRRSPTNKLFRAKTSATMDHCQLSLEAANSPPARTAPGPGPVSLTMTEDQNVCIIGGEKGTTVTNGKHFETKMKL